MKKVLLGLFVVLLLGLISYGAFLYIQSAKKVSDLSPVTNGEDDFPSEAAANNVPPLITGSKNLGDANKQGVGSGLAFPSDGSVGENGPEDVFVGESKIKKVWDKPVVGATSYGLFKSDSLHIRFMEAGTGHVYDYDVENGESRRVSGATIPKIKSVIWGNKGQSLVFQYLDKDNVVKNYVGRISLSTSTQGAGFSGDYVQGELLALVGSPPGFEILDCPPLLALKLERGRSNNPAEVKKLQGFLVGQGIKNVVETGLFDESTFGAVVLFQELYKDELLTPNGLVAGTGLVGPSTRKKINELYCQKGGQLVSGGRVAYQERLADTNYNIVTVEFDNGRNKNIVATKTGELLLSWPEKGTLMLATKPNSQVGGYLYSVPLGKSGSEIFSDVGVPLLRNVLGLTAIANPRVDRVVYGEVGPRQYLTKILDRKTKEIRVFPVSTIPSDKCVWDNNHPYLIYCAAPKQSLGTFEPESWYLGLSKNEDSIYAIDTETDTVKVIYAPEISGPDVSNIQISEDSSVLFFMDKTDSSLWAISLLSSQ